MDLGRLLSRAGLRDSHPRLQTPLRQGTLAERLSCDFLRLPRYRRRELYHRHRPLAAFLDDARSHVGHDRRRAALQGFRRATVHVRRSLVAGLPEGLLPEGLLLAGLASGESSMAFNASVASSTP